MEVGLHRFRYVDEGTILLGDVVGVATGDQQLEARDAVKLSPQEVVSKQGPLVVLSFRSAEDSGKVTLSLSIPVFGPKVSMLVTAQPLDGSIANPMAIPRLSRYVTRQWNENISLWALTVFSPDAVNRTNVHTEIHHNVEKNYELAGRKFDMAEYARETYTLAQVNTVSQLALAAECRFGPKARKKKARADKAPTLNQLRGIARTVPEPDGSDEEWDVPEAFRDSRLHGEHLVGFHQFRLAA